MCFAQVAGEEDVEGVGFDEHCFVIFGVAGCWDQGYVIYGWFVDRGIGKMAEAAGVVEVVVGEDDRGDLFRFDVEGC